MRRRDKGGGSPQHVMSQRERAWAHWRLGNHARPLRLRPIYNREGDAILLKEIHGRVWRLHFQFLKTRRLMRDIMSLYLIDS